MKLEIGMYVRTKNGMIAKIIDKRDVSGSLHREEIVFILDNGNKLALHSQKVVKASYNIIDLIEVGDYVNGCLVVKKYKECDYAKQCIKLKGNSNYFYDIDVHSLLTKEQFESVQYKVVE